MIIPSMYLSAQVLNGRIVGVCPACPLRGRHPVTGSTTARTRPCVIYCRICTALERVVPNGRHLPTIRHCRLCPLALNRHHGDVLCPPRSTADCANAGLEPTRESFILSSDGNDR